MYEKDRLLQLYATEETMWLHVMSQFGLEPTEQFAYEDEDDFQFSVRIYTLMEGQAKVVGYSGFLQEWVFRADNGEFVVTRIWE